MLGGSQLSRAAAPSGTRAALRHPRPAHLSAVVVLLLTVACDSDPTGAKPPPPGPPPPEPPPAECSAVPPASLRLEPMPVVPTAELRVVVADGAARVAPAVVAAGADPELAGAFRELSDWMTSATAPDASSCAALNRSAGAVAEFAEQAPPGASPDLAVLRKVLSLLYAWQASTG